MELTHGTPDGMMNNVVDNVSQLSQRILHQSDRSNLSPIEQKDSDNLQVINYMNTFLICWAIIVLTIMAAINIVARIKKFKSSSNNFHRRRPSLNNLKSSQSTNFLKYFFGSTNCHVNSIKRYSVLGALKVKGRQLSTVIEEDIETDFVTHR